ncbi:MAG TPA: MaoC family dehydratase [Candidatus Thermoplasmatota archaeon]|nr:MaoC family dehydratase [Candidatus Thermoplasmatota archaeon]
MPGLWFEEFAPGAVLRHREEVAVTQEDNAAFCRLTRNTQPLHLDEAYARTTPFGRVVVNGLYTLSLAVGVSVRDTTEGTLVANLGYEAVEHPKPVFPGDRLRFETEVVDKRPSSKPGRGVVTLLHRALNQAGDEVCRFRRTVMVQGRPGAP